MNLRMVISNNTLWPVRKQQSTDIPDENRTIIVMITACKSPPIRHVPPIRAPLFAAFSVAISVLLRQAPLLHLRMVWYHYLNLRLRTILGAAQSINGPSVALSSIFLPLPWVFLLLVFFSRSFSFSDASFLFNISHSVLWPLAVMRWGLAANGRRHSSDWLGDANRDELGNVKAVAVPVPRSSST